MSEALVYRQSRCAALAVLGVLLLVGCQTHGRDGAAPVGPVLAHDSAAQLTRRLHTCAACHGEDGVSTAEIFPSLAGQQRDYLVAQLTAFRDHTRRERDAQAYMWGMSAGLDDATIARLADDYANKPPAPGTSAPAANLALGESVYQHGVAERGLPACAACHGEQAKGNGAVPRLAGQHGDYLAVQLAAFASGARQNGAMTLFAKALKPGEARAVSAYVASLK
jgi:cytochrome c553